MPLPNLVIIGAQKSASSFLQTCLADHPEIFFPRGETPYFEDPSYGNVDESLECFFKNRQESILGIKRPSYIGRPEVPSRISRDLPEARLIAVLRNPVDRCLSAYYHLMRSGLAPLLHPEEGLKMILDARMPLDKFPRTTEILEYGRYGFYLSMYGNFLRSGRLLIFTQDELISDAARKLRDTYRWLGVDDSFISPSLNSRPQKVVYNLFRVRLLSWINLFANSISEDRMRVYPRDLSIIERLLVAGGRALDSWVLERIFVSRLPKLSTELRERLVVFYSKDLDRLEGLIGKPFPSLRG